MSSPARAAAARANGAKSTGPVTSDGRARSSQNALRHGLSAAVSAKAVVLPGEDSAEFTQLRDAYLERFQAADQAELDLIETMAVSRWRMRRIPTLEVGIFENIERLQARAGNQLGDDTPGNDAPGDMDLGAIFTEAAEGKSLSLLLRYEGQLTRTYERSLKALQTLQKARLTATQTSGDEVARELPNEPKPALRPRVLNSPAPSVSPFMDPGPSPDAPVLVSLHAFGPPAFGAPRRQAA